MQKRRCENRKHERPPDERRALGPVSPTKLEMGSVGHPTHLRRQRCCQGDKEWKSWGRDSDTLIGRLATALASGGARVQRARPMANRFRGNWQAMLSGDRGLSKPACLSELPGCDVSPTT